MTAAVLDIGALYKAHSHWLSSWLRRRTKCPFKAEDLTQDTFRRVLESGQDLPLRDAQNFLVVVARRLLIDDSRRQALERLYLASVSFNDDGVDHLTPERIASAVQELAALLDLLGQLPDDVRTAFILRRVDLLTHAEIAERLGISDRTVKRHIARAYALCYTLAYPD